LCLHDSILPEASSPNSKPLEGRNGRPTHQTAAKKLKSCHQIYDESIGIRPQMDNGQPRQSEDDQQREQLGPRGVPGKPDPAKMVPQRKKKTPSDFDPGHTA